MKHQSSICKNLCTVCVNLISFTLACSQISETTVLDIPQMHNEKIKTSNSNSNNNIHRHILFDWFEGEREEVKKQKSQNKHRKPNRKHYLW